MSGSRPNTGGRRVADQHLGDRLSALVDGELGHEARERVLAHLATCPRCKAEADAQRRLKNVFAEAAPPPPSESFLARLQGLPGGSDGGTGGSRLNGGNFAGGRLPAPAAGPDFPHGAGVFGVPGDPFGYEPSGPHAGVFPTPPSEERAPFGHRGPSGGPVVADGPALAESPGPAGGGASTALREPAGDRLDLDLEGGRGFRIHRVGRPENERPASRGLRFAFVAAGAVSLAAIALGGVSTGGPADTAEARGGSGSGSNVTPMRTAGAGAATGSESQRRRGAVGPLLGHGQQLLGGPVAPTAVSAPLLPGIPAQAVRVPATLRPPAVPVTAGATAPSPLIRPFTPPPAEPVWQAATGLTTPGLTVTGLTVTGSTDLVATAPGPMTPGLLATPFVPSPALTSPTLP
ncbi:anti-sigma factor family protein [Streptomyces sp. CRN 30]|uniref:anti-sigma factor family protein n=1 Tax=Streptomyces sp. CRN 30 TaxID=3075613 RepID=UPI002A805BF3|nr:zf-HC2 domain-containing protein [Streptomyces sp. CRN 30]